MVASIWMGTVAGAVESDVPAGPDGNDESNSFILIWESPNLQPVTVAALASISSFSIDTSTDYPDGSFTVENRIEHGWEATCVISEYSTVGHGTHFPNVPTLSTTEDVTRVLFKLTINNDTGLVGPEQTSVAVNAVMNGTVFIG